MEHWCESCGQAVLSDALPADTTLISAAADGHEHELVARPFAKPAGDNRKHRDKKLLLGVAGAVVAWLAFVGVGAVVSPDDDIDEAAAVELEEIVAREAEEAAAAAAEEEATTSNADNGETSDGLAADVDGEYAAADAAPGFPNDDSALDGVGEPGGDEFVVNTAQLERMSRQLDRRDSNVLLAYLSAEGVVVLDLRAGTSVLTRMARSDETVDAGAHLLRSGPDTFSINPDTRVVTQVFDDSSMVVSRSRAGGTYYVGATGLTLPSTPVTVLSDDGVASFPAPSNHQLLPFDGLGLVAVPNRPGGATLIADTESFRVLSEHRVLAGSANAMLEQICFTPSECSLAVTHHDERGGRWDVPPAFLRLGDNYELSPDGLTLLRFTNGGYAEAYGSEDASVAWVAGGGMQAPAWGPDSNFIAWLELLGEPKVKVMFLDERDWVTIEVADLGVPPPIGPDIVVFSPENE